MESLLSHGIFSKKCFCNQSAGDKPESNTKERAQQPAEQNSHCFVQAEPPSHGLGPFACFLHGVALHSVGPGTHTGERQQPVTRDITGSGSYITLSIYQVAFIKTVGYGFQQVKHGEGFEQVAVHTVPQCLNDMGGAAVPGYDYNRCARP